MRVFASGRYKVFVDALSDEGAWCFAPHQDWWLEPGAVVVFEADGELKLSFGRVDQHAPLPGRPAYEQLER